MLKDLAKEMKMGYEYYGIYVSHSSDLSVDKSAHDLSYVLFFINRFFDFPDEDRIIGKVYDNCEAEGSKLLFTYKGENVANVVAQFIKEWTDGTTFIILDYDNFIVESKYKHYNFCLLTCGGIWGK